MPETKTVREKLHMLVLFMEKTLPFIYLPSGMVPLTLISSYVFLDYSHMGAIWHLFIKYMWMLLYISYLVYLLAGNVGHKSHTGDGDVKKTEA